MMVMIRSVLFNLLFYITTAFFSSCIVLSWPLAPLSFRQRLGQQWSITNRFLLKWICQLHVDIHGLEHLPPAPYVVLSKHQSAWETIIYPSIFPPFVWVLKQSLLWIPLFGWVLKATKHIAINRDRSVESLKKIQKEGREHLAAGRCLIIFPEGTRIAPGEIGHYNPGGTLIALESQVPIVPVAHNAGVYWAKRSFLKKPGSIQVMIGEAILTQGLDRQQRKNVIRSVEERIETMMTTLNQGIPGKKIIPTATNNTTVIGP